MFTYTSIIDNKIYELDVDSFLNLNEEVTREQNKKKIQELCGENKITSLDLVDLGFSDEDIIEISQILKINTSVKSLNLMLNHIGCGGAKELGQVLKVNKTLKSLNLSCTFGEDPKDLYEGLKENTALTHLNLQSNNIEKEGIEVLAQVLKLNGILNHLDLSSNNIGEKGMEYICSLLSENRSLISLSLSHCNIGSIGVKDLFKVLRRNTSLTFLDLSGNKICKKGVKHIARYLTKNLTIKSLCLNYFFAEHNDFKDLTEALKINKELTSLTFQILKCKILQN